MRIAYSLLSLALAAALTWLAIRSVEDGRLDLGSVGIVIRREEEPTSFWALLTGLVVSIVALLLIGATLISSDPAP